MSENSSNSAAAVTRDNSRGFWALIVAQFQAAFNDNAYKNLLTVLAVYGAATRDEGNAMSSLVAIVFTAPFLMFSMYGGHFADHNSKRSVAIVTKLAEIGIMLLGALAFLRREFW